MLEIYLPIAKISINVLWLIGIGLGVGILTGMFGIGGGFVMTPLLMFMGIPPVTAVASDSNTIIASACSGAIAHWRRGNVRWKAGLLFAAGGILGSYLGVQLMKYLHGVGKEEFLIKGLYILFLVPVGIFMFRESLRKLRCGTAEEPKGFAAKIGEYFREKFSVGADISMKILLVLIGLVIGLFASVMGIGGGFIAVPILIYIVGFPTIVAVGTSLFQIAIIACNTTLQYSINMAGLGVDLLLAALLALGSTVGAQVGVYICTRTKGTLVRLLFASMILLMAVKLVGEFVLPSVFRFTIMTPAVQPEKLSGISQWVLDLALGQPLLYGLLAVGVALTLGILVGLIFNLRRKST